MLVWNVKASRLLIKDRRFSKYIILRPYQIFGPYQKFDRLIPFVIKNSLKGKNFNCSAGIQIRDFLFVDDFTLLIKKILKCKNIKSGIYILTLIVCSASSINFNASVILPWCPIIDALKYKHQK